MENGIGGFADYPVVRATLTFSFAPDTRYRMADNVAVSGNQSANQIIQKERREVEMKTIRRILAVLLLIVMGLVIGYLCFTGSRWKTMTEEQLPTEGYYAQETNGIY